jgi:hypothetical protein
VPEARESTAAFEEYFGPALLHLGYLLAQNAESEEWELRFCVLAGKEIKLFFSQDEDAAAPLGAIYLTTLSREPVEVRAVDAQYPAFSIANSADPRGAPFLFCAGNFDERDRWLRRLAGRDSPPPEAPARPASMPRSDSMDMAPSEQVDERALAAFAAALGPCSLAGYLKRRRRFTGTWALEFFFMTGTEILAFRDHRSDPRQPPLGVIYTCTASGRPFAVERGASSGRKHVFTIQNPNRSWTLAAQSKEEAERWLAAIDASVRAAAPK